MIWIDSYSRVNEDVTFGGCMVNRLLFADHLVLSAASEQCRQYALDRFAAAHNPFGKELSTEKTGIVSV